MTMTNREMQMQREQMAQLRDGFLEWSRWHETLCDESPCFAKAGALAFLAHSIGFQMNDLHQFILKLEDYNKHCVKNQEGECQDH